MENDRNMAENFQIIDFNLEIQILLRMFQNVFFCHFKWLGSLILTIHSMLELDADLNHFLLFFTSNTVHVHIRLCTHACIHIYIYIYRNGLNHIRSFACVLGVSENGKSPSPPWICSTIQSVVPVVSVAVSSVQRLEISISPEHRVEKSVSWSLWAWPSKRLSHHMMSSFGCCDVDDGLLEALTCVSRVSTALVFSSNLGKVLENL